MFNKTLVVVAVVGFISLGSDALYAADVVKDQTQDRLYSSLST